MHRARPQRLQLVVVFGAVELERVDAARVLVGIGFRQKHAHRVDAILEPMQRGELQVFKSESLEHLEPAAIRQATGSYGVLALADAVIE